MIRNLFLLLGFLVFFNSVLCQDEVVEDGEYEEQVERFNPNHDIPPEPVEIRDSKNPFDLGQDEMRSHIKDIIRGFSDKGFDESDNNKDGFLDVSEIETFINEKMGYLLKVKPAYVIHHFDMNKDRKLNKDEVWMIVEKKDPALFKVRPEIMEQNMMVMQGMQPDHFVDDDDNQQKDEDFHDEF